MKILLISLILSPINLALHASAIAQGAGTVDNGQANRELIILATTGNPAPLQRLVGGNVVNSDMLNMQAQSVLDVAQKEHLAPKALILDDGRMYAMVAPTITKDNFIYVDGDQLVRMDVGYTEGHNRPFVVETIVADGGASWWEELGHWFSGFIDR